MKIFFLCLLLSVTCFPQWQLIEPKLIIGDVVDICRDNNLFYAGTKDGELLVSSDNGYSWKHVKYFHQEIVRVGFLNNFGFVFPYLDSTIHLTYDYGNSWQSMKTPLTGFNYSATFIDPKNGFIITGSYLYQTKDSGNSWNRIIDTSVNYHISFDDVARISSNKVVVDGYFYYELDSNKFYKSFPPGSGGFHVLNVDDSLNYQYLNQDFDLIVTTDGGNSWRRFQEKVEYFDDPFLDLVVKGDSALTIARYHNDYSINSPKSIFLNNKEIQQVNLHKYNSPVIRRTTNAGLEWSTIENDHYLPSEIQKFNDGSIIIFGQRGIMQRSYNFGTNTTEVNRVAEWSTIADIEFFTDDFGFVFSNDFFKTYDGGKTFIKIPYNFNQYSLVAAAMPDTNTIIITTDSSVIIKSTDQGNTWKKIPIAVNPGYQMPDIKFYNENAGYISSISGLFKTTDKGETWNNVFIGGAYMIDLFDTNYIWITHYGKIFHSSDGGINWNDQGYQSVNYISFADKDHGIAGDDQLVYTTDGGKNWNKSQIEGLNSDYNVSELKLLKVNSKLFGFASFHPYSSKLQYKSYYTLDSGKTWIRDVNLPNSINNLSYAGNTLWASDITRGFLIKRNDFATLTSVKDNEDISINDYSLPQNYPNPFNPSTTIEFAIPKDGLYKVKIYNILGQEITTLINQELKQGIHKTTFDGNNLSSGIYFYQLQGMDVNITRKMVLAK